MSTTDTIAADGPNAEQIRYWNEQAGPKWVTLQDRLDQQLDELGRRAMDRAGIVPGETILDLGCGCGTTTLELAQRTGETGNVLGIDISAPMLELARRRAHDAGTRNARFELADAQTHQFSCASRDVAFSRFGVMFFADPVAAFDNVRRALRPGGRLAFVCWQSLGQNPWMSLPLAAVAQHVALPPPAGPDAPGPFAFADRERVSGILQEAGFTDVAFETLEEPITVGGTPDLDQAVEFLLTMGPTQALLAQADEGVRAQVVQSVRAAMAPHHGPKGVRLPAAAWVVRARYSR
ncbi:MAG: methyltransferase domain-containing protein [Deltaproteobacteria bacterium]|nr:methyltransferase domain-containing protein [Deltaproteobacteria bacterium]